MRAALTDARMLHRNRAYNPRAVTGGYVGEYQIRWGWSRGFATDEAIGYVRLTVANGTPRSGCGVDLYQNTQSLNPSNSYDAQPVFAGQTVRVAYEVRTSSPAPTSMMLTSWDGITQGTEVWSTPATNPVGVWTLTVMDYLVPADGFLAGRINVDANGWTSIDHFDIRRLYIGDPDGPYLDGSMPYCAWTGTPDASPSVGYMPLT